MDKSIKEIKKKTFSHMISTRRSKYFGFILAINSFRYLQPNKEKADLLEGYYILMRTIDDIVDGDLDLPQRYKSKEEFVGEKINFTLNQNAPKDNIDKLIIYCFHLANRLKIDIYEETKDILNSMLFDTKRIGKNIIFNEEQLNHHFNLLDIRGTIKGALKLFNEDPEKYLLIEPLGVASRIYYNLRDYKEDIKAGMINISNEEFIRYKINLEGLLIKDSNSIKKWFFEKSKTGLELITNYKTDIKIKDFGQLGKLTLKLVYELPASRYFTKIVNAQM